MSKLSGGGSLKVGEGITSPNGRYTLTLQADGNLVLSEAGGTAVWSTGTDGKNAARADMQADGNLVLYTADDGVVWASDTGEAGSSLEIQDDRNVVIYSRDRTVVWSPNTYISEAEKAELDAAEATAKAAEQAKADADAAAAATPPPPPAPAQRTYTVERGDSLSKIAKQFYGNGNDYMRIAQANNIANPDLIHPGQVLVIP